MSKTPLFCSTLALALGLSLALPAYAEDSAMSGGGMMQHKDAMSGGAMMSKDAMTHHKDNMMHKSAKQKTNKMHEGDKMGGDAMSK